jgi:hypothetical protein
MSKLHVCHLVSPAESQRDDVVKRLVAPRDGGTTNSADPSVTQTDRFGIYGFYVLAEKASPAAVLYLGLLAGIGTPIRAHDGGVGNTLAFLVELSPVGRRAFAIRFAPLATPLAAALALIVLSFVRRSISADALSIPLLPPSARHDLPQALTIRAELRHLATSAGYERRLTGDANGATRSHEEGAVGLVRRGDPGRRRWHWPSSAQEWSWRPR